MESKVYPKISMLKGFDTKYFVLWFVGGNIINFVFGGKAYFEGTRWYLRIEKNMYVSKHCWKIVF